ncbi:anaerobic sulfatase maturase [Prolixibacter sp. SD074]|uniref:anaerobic sulfatase maturase n=1 Tax=Prolixibacter sp. SD074 TaxID=2652391 RepID=UPI0012855902|nr:anaerobic sulfatase maturase [Prolixibacter sp. SD074]GET29539.1 anaerobic sulfatase maturase [Prolixibacter sp. SD074]
MSVRYKPLNSVLVKPAGPDCNLDCSYCFYLEKDELFPDTKVHRMSLEIQEEMIRQVMQQSGPNVSIAWQGGEPALMGLDFYKRAIELEKKYGYGKVVGNGFQTNGTLLNREWAKFFKEYDWLIGLSLDGPQHIHDRFRKDKSEQPTWVKVENVAKMLLEEGVAVNAMCCVTDYSADYAEELYNYYKRLGLTYMQFIPIVEPDKDDPTQAASFSVTAGKYGKFLVELFDLWLADFENGRPTTSIRHFETVFHTYVGMEAPECSFMRECGVYTVIEHNGNVYSCDFFVDPKHRLGNIRHDKIVNMLNSKKQQAFGRAKSAVPLKCKQCKWFTKCYGGCTKDRIKDPRDHRKPRFCEAYMMFFEHADGVLIQMAAEWKKQQSDYQEYQQSGGTYNAFKDFVKE